MALPKMGCCKGSRKVTIKLRYVRRRHWSEKWPMEALPGDLLLLEDQPMKGGAILRLPPPNAFIALTEEQVWRKIGIPWPNRSEDVLRFTIKGQVAEVLYR